MAGEIEIIYSCDFKILMKSSSGIFEQYYETPAHHFVERLTGSKIVSQVGKQDMKYDKWVVETISTDKNDVKEKTWAVEFISPKRSYSHGDWHEDMSIIWDILKYPLGGWFEIYTSNSCAFHVNASIGSRGAGAGAGGREQDYPTTTQQQWTLEQVRRLAKSCVYFERAVDALVPPHMRVAGSCRSNRHNPQLEGQPMFRVFNMIETADDVEEIAFLMCGHFLDDGRGRGIFAKQMRDRYHSQFIPDYTFRWNFRGLVTTKGKTPRPTGMVEFRQGPGVADVYEARDWFNFACAFVRAAIEGAIYLDPTVDPSMGLLREFLLIGDLCLESEWKKKIHEHNLKLRKREEDTQEEDTQEEETQGEETQEEETQEEETQQEQEEGEDEEEEEEEDEEVEEYKSYSSDVYEPNSPTWNRLFGHREDEGTPNLPKAEYRYKQEDKDGVWETGLYEIEAGEGRGPLVLQELAEEAGMDPDEFEALYVIM